MADTRQTRMQAYNLQEPNNEGANSHEQTHGYMRKFYKNKFTDVREDFTLAHMCERNFT